MVPGDIGQTYVMILVVQTETTVWFLAKKIKFCFAVHSSGSRSMAALYISQGCTPTVEVTLIKNFQRYKAC